MCQAATLTPPFHGAANDRYLSRLPRVLTSVHDLCCVMNLSPEGFNELIRGDIVFILSDIILHLIDERIRFSVANVIPSKSTKYMLERAHTMLDQPLRHAVSCITSDKGGGLFSEQAAILTQRWFTSLHCEPEDAHDCIIESHNELVRQNFMQ